MGTWPRHVDRFERQYDKAFTRDPLFGADLMNYIHKRVQVFLHSCNMTAIEDLEFGVPSGVWGDPEKVRERGVVDFNTNMGG